MMHGGTLARLVSALCGAVARWAILPVQPGWHGLAEPR